MKKKSSQPPIPLKYIPRFAAGIAATVAIASMTACATEYESDGEIVDNVRSEDPNETDLVEEENVEESDEGDNESNAGDVSDVDTVEIEERFVSFWEEAEEAELDESLVSLLTGPEMVDAEDTGNLITSDEELNAIVEEYIHQREFNEEELSRVGFAGESADMSNEEASEMVHYMPAIFPLSLQMMMSGEIDDSDADQMGLDPAEVTSGVVITGPTVVTEDIAVVQYAPNFMLDVMRQHGGEEAQEMSDEELIDVLTQGGQTELFTAELLYEDGRWLIDPIGFIEGFNI